MTQSSLRLKNLLARCSNELNDFRKRPVFSRDGLRFNESGLDCVGVSLGSSIFLGGFKVQWHTLSRWFANVEIKVRLFVAFRVLLPPQYQQ